MYSITLQQYCFTYRKTENPGSCSSNRRQATLKLCEPLENYLITLCLSLFFLIYKMEMIIVPI